MSLDARGGVQTVDVDAARIVDEIGLGGADEMAQLIVGDGDLGGIVAPRRQYKRVRVSTQEVIDGHGLRSGGRSLQHI